MPKMNIKTDYEIIDFSNGKARLNILVYVNEDEEPMKIVYLSGYSRYVTDAFVLGDIAMADLSNYE